MQPNIITIETEAFWKLVEQVLTKIEPKQPDKWISKEEALRLLQIKDTSLWKLRTEGRIRYTQPSRKVLLYDRDSIMQYLEQHVQEPFS